MHTCISGRCIDRDFTTFDPYVYTPYKHAFPISVYIGSLHPVNPYGQNRPDVRKEGVECMDHIDKLLQLLWGCLLTGIQIGYMKGAEQCIPAAPAAVGLAGCCWHARMRQPAGKGPCMPAWPMHASCCWLPTPMSVSRSMQCMPGHMSSLVRGCLLPNIYAPKPGSTGSEALCSTWSALTTLLPCWWQWALAPCRA
jgi:hypothetical protein